MECIFFIVWIIMIIIIPLLVSCLIYLFEENRKRAWTAFATANNLSVESGDFFTGGLHVSGDYRGYRLKLEKCKENKTTFTRVTLTRRQSRRPDKELRGNLTTQDVINTLAPSGLPLVISGKLKATASGREISYREAGIIRDLSALQYISNLLSDMVDGYPLIWAAGGEAVPALQTIATSYNGPQKVGVWKLREIAIRLLEDIARTTMAHQAEGLLCPICLVRFSPHQVRLSWLRSVTYYGCRQCGQSRKFFKGTVVAALDSRTGWAITKHEDTLRINWLARRTLFDFNVVEIIQANDEQVERFAVQVGNDTDPYRKSRYKRMPCFISYECRLSENSLRVLASVFGRVERVHETTDERCGFAKESQRPVAAC